MFRSWRIQKHQVIDLDLEYSVLSIKKAICLSKKKIKFISCTGVFMGKINSINTSTYWHYN